MISERAAQVNVWSVGRTHEQIRAAGFRVGETHRDRHRGSSESAENGDRHAGSTLHVAVVSASRSISTCAVRAGKGGCVARLLISGRKIEHSSRAPQRARAARPHQSHRVRGCQTSMRRQNRRGCTRNRVLRAMSAAHQRHSAAKPQLRGKRVRNFTSHVGTLASSGELRWSHEVR